MLRGMAKLEMMVVVVVVTCPHTADKATRI
jgi:hypothetical protein